MDAIDFIRKSYDKKIKNRRFFIKMGRQSKDYVEDWSCVGYVPKNLKLPGTNNNNNNKGKPHTQYKRPEKKEEVPAEKVETKT